MSVRLRPPAPFIFMVNITELRAGKFFEEKDDIFEVLNYEHLKMGRGSANIKLKVKNLRSGTITEKRFISGARVNEVHLEKKKVKFLWKDEASFNFTDTRSWEQFSLNKNQIGEAAKFLKEEEEYEILFFDKEALSLELPRLMEFTVAETGPGVKGDSVSNVYKSATLSNGMQVSVPLFIKNGDKIKIDTRIGEYVQRLTSKEKK